MSRNYQFETNWNRKQKLSFALWTTITCVSHKWRKLRRKSTSSIDAFTNIWNYWSVESMEKRNRSEWERESEMYRSHLTRDSSIIQMIYTIIICISHSCHKTYWQLNVCKIIQFWVSNTANELQNLAQVYNVLCTHCTVHSTWFSSLLCYAISIYVNYENIQQTTTNVQNSSICFV